MKVGRVGVRDWGVRVESVRVDEREREYGVGEYEVWEW